MLRHVANNWYEFVALLEEKFLDWPEYIFRGQRDSNWPLRSKFDREYKNAIKLLKETDPFDGLNEQDASLIKKHVNHNDSLDPRADILGRLLSSFRKACTGRRGSHPKDLTDTEWWTLGQHFGLATPLLDWTQSLYVAAYFALKEPTLLPPKNRAVWAFDDIEFNKILLEKRCKRHKEANEIDSIERVEGLIDENSRIISQSGLFTKTPEDEDIEEYIDNNINLLGSSPILYKIEIPDSERETFLRHLEAINIHDSSLFPDINGAAEYANRSLEKEAADRLWELRPDFFRRLDSDDVYHGNDEVGINS